MSSPQPTHIGHQLFRIAGGLLFAGSLLYAAMVYVLVFGHQPTPAAADNVFAAIAIDTLLFAGFALHHSVFARYGVKAWITRHVPSPLERSVYVWCASLLFIVVMRLWVEVPGVAWTVNGPTRWLLLAAQMSGVVITLLASRHIGVMALAGVRSAATAAAPVVLKHDGLYGFVRHPIYFAWLLLVWPAPVMTGSRLVFAVLTTAYLIAAIPLEERSLRRDFGAAYGDYQRKVRWKMLPGIY